MKRITTLTIVLLLYITTIKSQTFYVEYLYNPSRGNCIEEKYQIQFKPDIYYRIDLLNQDKKHLKVKEVTNNLDEVNRDYFNRVLRIDNMKITSAQLDFSRVVPIDADAENTHPKNIFRISNNQVLAYPVVESFGEGIFFSFNVELIN